MEGVLRDVRHAGAVFDLREEEGAVASHPGGVPPHDFQVRSDGSGEVGFVDNEQVGLGDARAAFARDFVAASDVNDVNSVIGQFAAEMGGQVVAPGFKQQNVRVKLLV